MAHQEKGRDSIVDQAKPFNGGENLYPRDTDAKRRDDERLAAWKSPKLVTNFAEFMGSSGGIGPAMEKTSPGGIHGQQSTAETTTQATSDLAHIPSATSGKDAEQGLTSSPNHQDASKAVPSSGNPDATGGADKQLVSKNGSPIDDPVKHAWPVARKSVGTKKLIDF